jgi:Tfp pilus assembly protein PilV
MHAPNRLERPLRPVVMTALRSGFAVVVAMLLILVLLPAVIAVQAASIEHHTTSRRLGARDDSLATTEMVSADPPERW